MRYEEMAGGLSRNVAEVRGCADVTSGIAGLCDSTPCVPIAIPFQEKSHDVLK